MKFNTTHNISGKVYQEEKQSVITEIYQSNYLALCYFAYKFLNDKEEAQDIVMDAFITLINKSELNNSKSAKSFLYTTVYNRCLDYIRKQQVKGNYQLYLASINEPFDSSGSSEVLMAEVLQSIYREIENLPEQRKVIFKSIYFEGKKTAAIAAELNISQQTVLNQKAKALQTIKVKLSKSMKYDLAVLAITACHILFNRV